jgi:hypothetical protein
VLARVELGHVDVDERTSGFCHAVFEAVVKSL